MNEVFKTFLSLSLSGSLLMLIVFLCNRLLKDRISRQWQYYIWIVVIARFLLPFAPEVNLIGNVFQILGTSYYGVEIQQSKPEDSSVGDKAEEEVNNINTGGGNTERQKPADIRPLCDIVNMFTDQIWFLWLAVAVMLLIRKITIYQGFVRYMKAGQVPVSDTGLLDRIALAGEQAGVKRAIELCVNPLITSPLLTGFFRACIILPCTELPEQDFQYIILHELTHYRRRDMFYKWMVQITVCLHWFNPLVLLMGREINRACEFSCDEAIISKMGTGSAGDYGRTLLGAMVSAGQYKERLASITLNENKRLLKERIGAVMKFQKKSGPAAALTLALTVILGAAGAAAGAYAFPGQGERQTVQEQAEIKTSNSMEIGMDRCNQPVISAAVYNGGIEILPADSGEITAIYDEQAYDVRLEQENGGWKVDIGGKMAKMGLWPYVKLYIPDTGCRINVDVLDGSFYYELQDGGTDDITIKAADSNVEFVSAVQYENCDIIVTAEKKEYLEYCPVRKPGYFTQSQDSVTYLNGTGNNRIQVILTGYTNVDFNE